MAFFEQFTLNNTSTQTNPFNSNNVFVQDATQQEGQSQIEILAQILLELKILNQQIYELPRLIATGTQSKDEPQTLRTEPSIFNI
jgi:hypothetical protein